MTINMKKANLNVLRALLISLLMTGCSGEDGIDGLNSLVITLIEQPGNNCSNGGFQIQTGIDLNSNNQLEAEGSLKYSGWGVGFPNHSDTSFLIKLTFFIPPISDVEEQ